MEKFIDPKETDIRGLFSMQQVYVVPVHQRPYTWAREQWEALYDDISSLSAKDIHFLGSIVVIPDQLKLGVNFFQIQDGQQRLATIIILMTVLRDLAESTNIVGSYSNYIYVKDYDGKSISRLALGETDNPALQTILGRTSKNYPHSIFECYDYFKNRMEQDFSRDLKAGIKEIWGKLLEKVFVVHINAFNDFNAFQLFETLNDRGLELSAVDLIKTYLLREVSKKKPILNKVVAQWNEMLENVKDIEPVKFFHRYMLSRFKGKVSEKRLNKVLRNSVKKEKWKSEQILEFMTDLSKKSVIYRHICEANFYESPRINRKLKDLKLVEVAPSYTLLLQVFPFYEKQILDQDGIVEILNMIEIFHIRWGICLQATAMLYKIYGEICGNLLKKSNALNMNSAEILGIIKNRLNDEIRANVNDDVFATNFLKRELKPSEKRTKHILYKLSKPTGETDISIDNIETEHIMPLTLSPDWLSYLISKTNLKEKDIHEKHKEYCNRIGNLTIIKGKWNRSMSNKLFKIKRDGYYKNSEFVITKNLCARSDWTFEDIEKRSTELCDLAVKEIWKW